MKWTRHLNPPLFWTSIVFIGLAIIFAISSLIDERTVLGIPLWYKPLKFAISIAVYTITLAWLVPYASSNRVKNAVVYGTILSMVIEIILIAMQAARGTLSHFNYEDVFGFVVYAVMGVFIVMAALLLIWLGVHLSRNRPQSWTPSFALAVSLAILLSTVGSVVGGYMSTQTGHTVGAPDGGPGLPLLSWSTLYGDWRVAHFIGLHALQLFLLVGWWTRVWRQAKGLLWLLFTIFSAFFTYVVWMTISGVSIFQG
jgi:hypothetical protein